MAVIRSMTTALRFQTDTSGLRQYEAAVGRVKSLALEIGKAFGLVFAIEQIGSFAKGIIDAGREMNRLNSQVANLARPMDDVRKLQSDIFDIAQRTGVEYQNVGTTMRNFLAQSQDLHVSQEQIAGATENIYKALRVGRASAEDMGRAMSSLEATFRMGRLTPRALGGLFLSSPEVVRLMAEAYGTNIEGLRAMAKAGELTAESLITHFSRSNRYLNEQFGRLPVSLSVAWTRIRNDLTYAAAQVWRVTQGFQQLGSVIWWVYSGFASAVRGIVNALGGLENTLRIVQLALLLVVGPLMVAKIVAFAVASWSAVLPWLALGAAVVAAALAIDDFMAWIRGDRQSLIGTWVGPFEQIRKQIEESAPFKLFEGIRDIFRGEMGEGWEKIKTALGNVNTWLITIVGSIGLVKAGFLLWDALTFLGLTGSLAGVKAQVDQVKAAADQAKTSLQHVGDAKISTGGILSGALSYTGLAYNAMREAQRQTQLPPEQVAAEQKVRADALMNLPGLKELGQAYDWLQQSAAGQALAAAGDWTREKLGLTGGGGATLADMAKPVGTVQFQDWDRPAQTNNVAPVLNQINNINVTTSPDEAAIAALVSQGVQSQAPGLLDQVTRQVQDAIPRLERATQ